VNFLFFGSRDLKLNKRDFKKRAIVKIICIILFHTIKIKVSNLIFHTIYLKIKIKVSWHGKIVYFYWVSGENTLFY